MNGAAVILKQKKLMRCFRDAGAVSPDTARSLQEIGVRDSWVFRRLMHDGVFVPADTGVYYLDRVAAGRYRDQWRMKAMTITALVLLLAFMIWLLVR